MTPSVSRETLEALQEFERRLLHWSGSINLIGRNETTVLRERHTMDSLHLLSASRGRWARWVDLGSGGGFPGLVVAIACRDDASKTVCLVESDQRKAAFLRAVASDLSPRTEIVVQRIEAVASLRGDVISARALAPLKTLLDYALRHGMPDAEALFPKGRSVDQEIEDAGMRFNFDLERLPGSGGSVGLILRVTNISPRLVSSA